MIVLSGTKELIFDEAIRLFAEFGFASVNMRQIAANVKIKASSIYNHFDGKQKILEEIYSYFKQHFWDNKNPEEQTKKLIEYGSKDEILKSIAFTFESSDIKKNQRMILTSKIIYMRIFDDADARAIFHSIMLNEPISYVEKLMNYGVSIGRFAPFDTLTFAKLMIGCRHSMALSAFSTPDYIISQLDDEQRLDQILKTMLPLIE